MYIPMRFWCLRRATTLIVLHPSGGTTRSPATIPPFLRRLTLYAQMLQVEDAPSRYDLSTLLHVRLRWRIVAPEIFRRGMTALAWRSAT